MMKAVRGIQAARNATAYVCDQEGNHKGQGLLLDLGREGSVVLTCHHVIAPVREADLRVRVPGPDGRLEDLIRVRYDEERSRPQMDAVVLRLEGVRRAERPLLHKLGLDAYNGSLEATVLTHLMPNNFNAAVRSSTPLDIDVIAKGSWPDPPDRYTLQAFRLADPSDARGGISGGVVLCEEGVLGLVHFARAEGSPHAREDYLVPLSAWAHGWPALDRLIDPLIDSNLGNAARVKRAREMEIGTDIILANYNGDLYVQRQADDHAQSALEQRESVVIVGKPKSGKTRLAWQLLRTQPEALVVVPDSYSARPPAFEASGLLDSELVLFIDDLHRVAQTMDLLEWRRRLEDASGKRCLLVCTTRDSQDWELVKDEQSLLLDSLGPSATAFTSQTGGPGEEEGEDFPEVQGRLLAGALKMSKKEFKNRFDGTPGSLLLDLQDMRRRYRTLRDDERGSVSMSRLLDSAKLLDRSGQPAFRKDVLRAVAEEIRGSGCIGAEVWDSLVRNTQNAGFGQFDGAGNFQTYRPYLEQCVSYDPSKEEIRQLQEIFYRESDPNGLFYLGVHYMDSEPSEPKQSIACLEQALKLKSDDPAAWHNKGVALHAVGQHEDALEAYDTALSLEPDYPQTLNNKGVVLRNLSRLEEALEAYDKILSSRFSDFWARTNKGNVLSDLDRLEEALEAHNRALTIRPDYSDAHYNKGNTLHRLGRFEEALEAYDRALTLEPDYPEIHYNSGKVMEDMGRYEEALEAYAQALTLRPEYPEALYNKGVILHHLGRRQEALEAFNKALDLKPDHAHASYNKGITLYDLGRYEEALEACDRALAMRPEYAKVWNDKGTILEGLGRPEEALGAYNRTLIFDPEDPIAHLNKGNTLAGLGRYEEALEAYDQALSLSPDYEEAWVNKGAVLGSLGKHEEAVEAYDAALVIRPDFAEVLYNKGLALDELGRKDEAIQAFGIAFKIRPDLAEALYRQVIALLEQERVEKAIDHLCRAWLTREQLSDSGAGLVRLFKFLGKDPEECT